MKKLLMITGGIAILCLLVVGICVGLGMWGISNVIDIPDDETKTNIEKSYGDDIKKIRSQLSANKSVKYSETNFKLSDDVIGIMKKDPQDIFKIDDVYKKYSGVKRTNYSSMDGIGKSEVLANNATVHCITYEIDIGTDEYIILLKDNEYGKVKPKVHTKSNSSQ